MIELRRKDLASRPIRPLKRDEYHRLGELGCFDHERVELLGGMLVAKSPIGPLHTYSVRRLTKLFILALHDRALVQPQGPFAASDDSEPEPDLAVLSLDDDRPVITDKALLVVEVSDSSLAMDRGFKCRLYATAGVKEYWVVNVRDQIIEVHRAPRRGRYTKVTRHVSGELSPLAFPDVRIAVAEVFPQPTAQKRS